MLDRSSKNMQISNVVKIRPVGAEMVHVDERTDRHGEAKSRFSQFRPTVPAKCTAAHNNALWSKNTTTSLWREVGGLKASDFGTR